MKRGIHYFRTLNILPRFNINKTQLKKNYYKLSKVYHPDRTAVITDEQSLINESYKVLNEDLSRYSYLTASLCKHYSIICDIPSSSFLEHVMDLYEKEDYTSLNYEYVAHLKKLQQKTIQFDESNELKLLEEIGSTLSKVNILKRYNT